jgi:hypothetical protein
MMPTPEARELEARDKVTKARRDCEVLAALDSGALLVMQIRFDTAMDAYRTAVRAALVAEMVAGVRDLEWEYRDGIPVRYLQREQVLTYLHGLAPETDPNG